MSDRMAEAVEAAARVLVWEQSHGCYTYRPEGHSERDDMDRYADAHARAALEAASPYMQAAALEEAAGVIDEDQYDCYDPYYADWLRARAAAVGGEG